LLSSVLHVRAIPWTKSWQFFLESASRTRHDTLCDPANIQYVPTEAPCIFNLTMIWSMWGSGVYRLIGRHPRLDRSVGNHSMVHADAFVLKEKQRGHFMQLGKA